MRMLWLVVTVVVAVGCGPKRKNQCPGNTAGHCLLGERCSYDRKRDCQVCVCEDLNGNPQRPEPDDTSRPPDVR